MAFLNRNQQTELEQLPPEVSALFSRYRQALPDRDAGAEFMPALWERIERQKRITYSFRRLASGFVSAAAAMSMLFAVALWTPSLHSNSNNNNNNGSTYIEVLSNDSSEYASVNDAA